MFASANRRKGFQYPVASTVPATLVKFHIKIKKLDSGCPEKNAPAALQVENYTRTGRNLQYSVERQLRHFHLRSGFCNFSFVLFVISFWFHLKSVLSAFLTLTN
jgi:hypothetical protein